jgi:putative DNA methylase
MSPKLVEVALPLEAISVASRRDKDKKTGTIKNVHKWFAPMPTPAWRALLFAALVDDPGDGLKRAELLRLVERLVPPDGNPPDAATLAEAHKVLMEATDGQPPTVFDPFCGGGSTLVEAQRLGLPAAGSDLNPVPVLITRVLTQLLPQVAGRPPLVAAPGTLAGVAGGGPLDGFLADCRHYAERVRDQVWGQIGHLYPEPPGGGTVIAWLWARTVICPNPACRAIAPLVSSFWLSKKKGALTWIEPTDLRPGHPVRFEVRTGDGGPPINTTMGRVAARCLVCGESIALAHVRTEGQAGRLDTQLLAAAVDGPGRHRRFVSPAESGPATTPAASPADAPDLKLSGKATINVGLYGIETQADLYSSRQLVALGAFADAVAGAPTWVAADGGDATYAQAVASVLGICVSKLAMGHSTQARFEPVTKSSNGGIHPAFSRQALPMVWDFAELNPFSGAAGEWTSQLGSLIRGLGKLPLPTHPSRTFQSDARVAGGLLGSAGLVATDPPYFAQINYADLSDYFYVWLRRSLAGVHPDLFATVATPKSDELIAAPYRHGGSKAQATKYFVEGFTEAFHSLAAASAPELPMLIVYAHRQEESDGDGVATSTAWDAMLSAILAAGLRIVGTWPIHATTSNRQIGQGTNALASYMVLVCRPQEAAAKSTDRQGLVAALHAELPRAIRKLQEGDISTIDLGPAAIGPGMAVFSRFSKVIEPTGAAMTVGGALNLISQVSAEVLDEFVGDLDNETRWAMGWFKDHGFDPGTYDDAEKLCKTTVTSLEGLKRAGIATGAKNKVALIPRAELPDGWDPATDNRPTVWEVTQHLVKRLTSAGGEAAAADLLRRCRRWGDAARDLAQWLAAASLASRPAEALDHDALVTSWSELVRLAERPESTQGVLTPVDTVDG